MLIVKTFNFAQEEDGDSVVDEKIKSKFATYLLHVDFSNAYL